MQKCRLLLGIVILITIALCVDAKQIVIKPHIPFDRVGGNVTSVAFSPDGQVLVIGTAYSYSGGYATIRLKDVKTREIITVLEVNPQLAVYDAVESIAFSPDGKIVASIENYGLGGDRFNKRFQLALWDVTTQRRVTSWQGFFECMAFSPDGRFLAAGTHDDSNPPDGVIKIWDSTTYRNIANLKGHESGVEKVGNVWKGFSGEPSSVAFSPDGTIIASGAMDSHHTTIKMWDVTNWQEMDSLETGSPVSFLTFSPNGELLTSYGDTIKLWNVATGENIATLEGKSKKAVALSPDGNILAGSAGNTIELWDMATLQKIATLEGHSASVNSLAFSPDGTVLASGSYDGTTRLWDIASQQEISWGNLMGHVRGPRLITFSPDEKILASAGGEIIKLWDVVTGKHLATLKGHSGRVNSIAFSPNGKILASGSEDETIKIWEIATGNSIATLEEDSELADRVNSIAFSPDGKILASGTYRRIKLWDMVTFQNIDTLEGYSKGDVTSVLIAQDGTFLASISYGEIK